MLAESGKLCGTWKIGSRWSVNCHEPEGTYVEGAYQVPALPKRVLKIVNLHRHRWGRSADGGTVVRAEERLLVFRHRSMIEHALDPAGCLNHGQI